MGRLKFLQYMPMKPCKRGIKIWPQYDANNGYLCQSEISTEKDNEDDQQDPTCPVKGLSACVAYELYKETLCHYGERKHLSPHEV